MRLDIYRRHENGNQYSYLAVPATRRIPEEANATDWERHECVDVDENDETLGQYLIDRPGDQIREKGYAITSVRKLNGHGASRA